ncbi:MAG: carbohydrate ABC transporter permease, partial [Spirochaetes bacterium]
MQYKSKKLINKIVIYLILLILAVIILFPFFWMVSTALKPNTDIIKRPPLFLPTKATLVHFKQVFVNVPYFKSLYNSIFISGITTLITIFFSTMVGYAIARYKVVGLNILFILILSGLMIPPFTIAIPLYIVATKLHMVDTLWGVIIPFSISNFGIFLMLQYSLGIPEDLISAARIDGASEFSIFI